MTTSRVISPRPSRYYLKRDGPESFKEGRRQDGSEQSEKSFGGEVTALQAKM